MTNEVISEETETEEKQPNKVVTWIKDHKDNIRDVLIGAGAVGALVAITRLGKSDEFDDSDDDEFDVIEGSVESESTDSSDTK